MEEESTPFRSLMCAIVLALMALPLAAPTARGAEATVSVLADFGDGTYRWADVSLPPSNRTALKATALANASWGLPVMNVTWFDSSFCIHRPCALVNDIGERHPRYPVWWHFFVWNASADSWDSAPYGPSDTVLMDGAAIAWYLAIDDPVTFAAPRPAPRPDLRDVQVSFRGDLTNAGSAHGSIPVTNHVRWDVDIGVKEIDTTPIAAYGNLYVATRSALVALDASTGRQVWRNTDVHDLLSTPALYDGHLVLGGTDGRLHYVDAYNGTETWRILLEPGARSSGIASSPAVYMGRAYVGTFNESAGGMGRVAAVNLNNGTLAWSYETASVHLSQPAIARGALYVGIMGAYDGTVGYSAPYGILSLSLDGVLNWFYPTNGPVASSPVVAANRIFVPSQDGFLYALNTDGRLAWTLQIGAATSSAAWAGDRLFVATGALGSSGKILAFDAEGNRAWEADAGGGMEASLVSDGKLVCGSTNVANGAIVCVHAIDGSPAWTYTPAPPNFILGSPSVIGNSMYAPSDNGHVYAFGPASPADSTGLWVAGTIIVTVAATAAAVLVWRRRRSGLA